MADFAKIVRASDGEQVLFWKSADGDGTPVLCQATQVDGMLAEFNLGFSDTEGGWADRETAFESSDIARADDVRAAVKSLALRSDE